MISQKQTPNRIRSGHCMRFHTDPVDVWEQCSFHPVKDIIFSPFAINIQVVHFFKDFRFHQSGWYGRFTDQTIVIMPAQMCFTVKRIRRFYVRLVKQAFWADASRPFHSRSL